MKAITMADVAEQAGVSKSTVSQFLNERFDYMGKETKVKIEKAIEELGYSPNIVARSLKQKSTMTIGVIVANILHVFSTQVIRAIEDYCNESNFHIIVCNADDDPTKEKRYIDMLRAKQVDGIIAFPTGGNAELYNKLIKANYPVVFMDRILTGVPVPTVMLDNNKASLIAVSQLVKDGYQRIGMIAPPLSSCVTSRVERIDGYKQALQKHGIPFNPDYLVSGEITDLEVKIHHMLTQAEPPEAIVALNDRVLFEILTYAKKQQLTIPKDLALIGIDDVSYASIYSPALTTIAQPAFQMGEKAAELLLSRIRNKSNEGILDVYRFEPNLIKRESC
ncbi:LacI family DNA-binding transcriptional regulator [Virgibacillus necropolis]|uniref:LacI family transcriptional regulator n=1 Tax=Virgibacillus necropolis TaxID=163877 RepID=A0A221M9W3_9BACI|nr:substrate-binding domain-containing protein [Virgibacillus necropolis]ASN04437.1 LacI family transcriptional regulator [Virgibacillus necropolis]